MTDFVAQSAGNSSHQVQIAYLRQIRYMGCTSTAQDADTVMYGSLAYLEDGAGMGRVYDSSRQNDEVAGRMQVAGFGERSRLGGCWSWGQQQLGQNPAPSD